MWLQLFKIKEGRKGEAGKWQLSYWYISRGASQRAQIWGLLI